MNPKAKRILLWALLISLILVCGVTIAYMYRATEPVENQFVKGHVDCVVAEVFNGTNKSSIKVTNTGNIDAYLRVRLVSYWVRLTEDGAEEIAPIPSEMPAITATADWIKASDSYTYYHTAPVAPGGEVELLASPIVLADKEEDGVTYYQVVEVFADAIQSLPAEAVTTSWGVTLDSTGKNITSVP